jgi:ureidoacrylate peracid hydrolase
MPGAIKLKIKEGKYYGSDLKLEPRHAALLVIDLQNDFLHPDGVFARKGVLVEDLRKRILAVVKLSNLCREAGIRIIHVRHSIDQDKTGRAVNAGLFVSTVRPWLLREGLRSGTWGSQMLSELGTPDYEIEKHRLSGFFETSLESLLRNLNTTTLVFSGFSTNLCVEHTFRDAVIRDFWAIAVKEAMIAHEPQLQKASEKNMEIMGRCLSLSEIEAILGRSVV